MTFCSYFYLQPGSFPFEGLFFMTMLLVGNYAVYDISGRVSLIDRQTVMIYFLFQTLCYVGIGIELRAISSLYFALLPSMFYLFTGHSKDSRVKGFALLGIGCLVYFAFYNYDGLAPRDAEAFKAHLSLIAFAICSVGIFYSAILAERSRTFQRFFKFSKDAVTSKEIEKEDRIFFHDLINQAHSINLYLDNKLRKMSGLEPSEIRSVIREVKTIQMLVQDYFKLSHKNSVNSNIYLPFNELRENIDHLFESYLCYPGVEYSLEFKGDLERPMISFDSCLVDSKVLMRVLVNLIKNIAEEKSCDVKAEFLYDQDGLHIAIKNRLFEDKQNPRSSASELEKIILAGDFPKSKRRETGLGLESVTMLCEESGGKFSFSFDGEYWISIVHLPNPVGGLLKAA